MEIIKELFQERQFCNSNVLALGSSGSGKTSCLILPAILNNLGSSFLISDVKNHLYNTLSDYLKEHGYKTILYDFQDHNPLSEPYNVFQTEDSTEAIEKICTMLLPDSLDDELFWARSSQMVLSTFIFYMNYKFEPQSRNAKTLTYLWGTFQKQLKNKEPTFFDELEALSDENDLKAQDILRQYHMWGVNCVGAERTFQSIALFVSQALALFHRCPEKLSVYSPNQFDCKKLNTEKVAIFVNQSDTNHLMDPILGLLFSQFFDAAFRAADENPDNKLKIPLKIYVDDAGSGFKIEGLDKIFNTARSRNISICLALQSLSQLEMYGRYQKTAILDSCDQIAYFGCNSTETIHFIASKCNLLPDTIGNLPLDEMILYRRGLKPIRQKKPQPDTYYEIIKNETKRKDQSYEK